MLTRKTTVARPFDPDLEIEYCTFSDKRDPYVVISEGNHSVKLRKSDLSRITRTLNRNLREQK